MIIKSSTPVGLTTQFVQQSTAASIAEIMSLNPVQA